jgi:hypothetical protein
VFVRVIVGSPFLPAKPSVSNKTVPGGQGQPRKAACL